MLTTTLALAFASVASAAVFNVDVGMGGLNYTPPFLQSVQAEDVIVFKFHQKNHTVTQSSLVDPCRPSPGGFDSGFQPVADESSTKTVSYTVPQSDSPLWYYCMQKGHCGSGMVFGINANQEQFNAFQQKAIALNGTSTSSVATATSTLPPPPVLTVTATVTVGTSAYTTIYGSWAGSPDATPAASPVVHTVEVGNNGTLTFDPQTVVAAIGDIVKYRFHPKNHTVTQSSFADPCSPLPNGINSGFMAVSANATILPTFNVTVKDTAPLWVYCQQTGHCQQGMVHAVNPPPYGNYSFEAFRARALASNSSANSTSTATGTGTGAASPTSGAISTSVTGVGLTGILAVIGIVALMF